MAGSPRFGGAFAFVLLLAAPALAADDRNDALVRARALYNQRQYNAAIAAAEQARGVAGRADSADLIAARAYLERFRGRETSDELTDLTNARERLNRVDPRRFGPREQVEFVVGLGEALYFDDSYGAAAVVFGSILDRLDTLTPGARDRVLDWWASALDRDARPRSEFDRQAVYQRIKDRMQTELGKSPGSAAAAYWVSASARGQGDLQGAWEAALAGWVRSTLAADRGVDLRADLDLLVMRALVPERARALGQPPDVIRFEWERFKERWAK